MRAVAMGIVCASAMAACGGDGIVAVSALQNGELRYRAANSQGVPLLTGSLRLVAHADSTVTGTWSIAWVPGADTTLPVGPQVGTGTLSGRQFADGTVQLNLNPLYADNNVFLNATVTRNGLTGEWSWSGFAGPLATGPFHAAF